MFSPIFIGFNKIIQKKDQVHVNKLNVREMEENIGRRKMFGHKRADLINKNTYISERGATIWPKAILKKGEKLKNPSSRLQLQCSENYEIT